MKICVPSKNRAGLMETHKTFSNQEVIVFVEPQDLEKYQSAYPEMTLVNIQQNDKGIGYVRNFILNYMGSQRFIMADDDIVGLTKRSAIKRNTSNAAVYSPVSPEEVIKHLNSHLDNAEFVGFVQEAYAHFSEGGHTVNKGYPIQLVAIDGGALQTIRYDEELWSLEDVDFAIRVIEAGLHIIVSSEYCYKQNGKLKSNFFADDTGKRNKLSTVAAEKLYEKYVALDKAHYLTLVHRTKPAHRERKYLRVNYHKIINL